MKKVNKVWAVIVCCLFTATIVRAAQNEMFAVNDVGGSQMYNNPLGMVVGHDGYLYVLTNRMIVKVDPTTGAQTPFADLSSHNNASMMVGDDSGNLFVVDTSAEQLLKVTPDGAVTYITGQFSPIPKLTGGTLKSAWYDNIQGIAVDHKGYVYLSDDACIQKIDIPGNSVTIFAGSPATTSSSGYVDGKGTDARFWRPTYMTVDGFGNVYVADWGNYLIRKVTPDGTVTTVAGKVGVNAFSDGTGTNASFNGMGSLIITPAGDIYMAQSSGLLRKITSQGVVTTPNLSFGGQFHGFYSPTCLSVTEGGVLYLFDNVSGGNYMSWVLKKATLMGLATGSGTRFINISTRANVGTGQDILIAGFVVTGTTSKRVLIRGAGPTLSNMGVTDGYLADPLITLYDGKGVPIGENDNWSDDAGLSAAFDQVGAFGFKAGSKDAAMIATLQPGNYSVGVAGADGGTGVALLEVYELPAQ